MKARSPLANIENSIDAHQHHPSESYGTYPQMDLIDPTTGKKVKDYELRNLQRLETMKNKKLAE